MGSGFACKHVLVWSRSWNRSARLTSDMHRLGRNQGTGTASQNTPARRGSAGLGRISQWHCGFASIHSTWKKEYRESRDVFGSASVHKLRVRLFSGTGTAWHRTDVCVHSVKSSFPPKICSFTQTTCWEWFLNCTNLRSWGGRGCNIIWSTGQ